VKARASTSSARTVASRTQAARMDMDMDMVMNIDIDMDMGMVLLTRWRSGRGPPTRSH